MGRELFIRHISANAMEEDLFKLFSVCGTVNSVHLVTDPDTGKLTGCGFVRMASDEEAKDAQETLDGALLVDRVIIVGEARPQKQQLKPGAKRPGGYKGRSTAGGREKPAGGGREKPVESVRERPSGAGKERPSGAGKERPAGTGRERPVGAGKDRPVGGGKDRPASGGKARPTGRGRK